MFKTSTAHDHRRRRRRRRTHPTDDAAAVAAGFPSFSLRRRLLRPALLCLVLLSVMASGFVISPPASSSARPSAAAISTTTRLFMTSSLPDIQSMKAGEIRKELESYGISTRSFLEKSELVSALEKARAEGKKPKESSSSSSGANGQQSTSTTASSSSSSTSSSRTMSREERLQQEMERAKGMSVGQLRDELNEMGLSTKSFFEKSEFVKAYAEAIVDGLKGGHIGGGGSTDTGRRSTTAAQDEPYDPTYRDVVMQKFDRRSKALLGSGGGPIIDIRLR